MRSVSEHELRRDLPAALQRAEAGERIVITVDEREVAELGPVRHRQFVPASEARAMFAGLPQLHGLSAELDEASGGFVDPWA